MTRQLCSSPKPTRDRVGVEIGVFVEQLLLAKVSLRQNVCTSSARLAARHLREGERGAELSAIAKLEVGMRHLTPTQP